MPEYRSEEAKERRRERNRIASKRRKAERAIAEGRTPGVKGRIKYKTEEERKAADRAAQVRWRERNIEFVRARDAEIQRKKRKQRAENEGRPVGVYGRPRIFTPDERREHARKNSLKWFDEHPEKRKELAAKYYSENKDRCLAKCRNRRALKDSIGGTHSKADIDAIFALQKGKCAFCLKPFRNGKFEIDHHVPIARGGTNDRSNLKLLHATCNRSKGARDPYEHAQRNGLLCW